MYAFVCTHVCFHMHEHGMAYMGNQRTILQVSFPLPPCRTQKVNSGHKAWWRASLPTEPFHWPEGYQPLFKHVLCRCSLPFLSWPSTLGSVKALLLDIVPVSTFTLVTCTFRDIVSMSQRPQTPLLCS